MSAPLDHLPDWFSPDETGTSIASLTGDRAKHLLGIALGFIEANRASLLDGKATRRPDAIEHEGRRCMAFAKYAALRGVSRQTLYAWLRAGIIPADAVNRVTPRAVFIDIERADAALEAGRGKPPRRDVCRPKVDEIDAALVAEAECLGMTVAELKAALAEATPSTTD